MILNDDLAKNEWPAELDALKAGGGHLPLSLKALNKELFDANKNKVTKSAKWTLARAINTGVCYQSSFVGCHAADLESYKIFSFLFNPVIEGYHVGYKVDGSMKHVTDMDVNKITTDL